MGGWALTTKLAGEDAGLSFLKVGGVSVLAMFVVQTAFFLMGKKRLVYRILFNIAFSSCIVWFMLCLLLPVLWVQSVGSGWKSALFLFLLMLCFANIGKAGKLFASAWEREGERALPRCYNSKNNTLDWPTIISLMKCPLALYIPGIPERMNPVVSVSIIASMLVGLSLRNTFPTFSLFAWGIPSCLVISLFMQMIGLGVAQIEKVLTLEKRYGVLLGPKI